MQVSLKTGWASWVEGRCEVVRVLKRDPPGDAEPFALVENKYIAFCIYHEI